LRPRSEERRRRVSKNVPTRTTGTRLLDHPSTRSLRGLLSDCVGGQAFFWAPWLFVSEDGVEDGEEFAGRSDGDEHFGLAGVDEALAEGLEDGVVTAGGEACEKEGRAHRFAAAGDHGLTLPLAGLADSRIPPICSRG
jgi:hypothetical protein